MKYEMVPVDIEKLRSLITNKTGLSFQEMSRTLGYSKSFFNHVFTRGTIQKQAVESLGNQFGIKYEQYAPGPNSEDVFRPRPAPEPAPTPAPRVIASGDFDKVSEIFSELARITVDLKKINQRVINIASLLGE